MADWNVDLTATTAPPPPKAPAGAWSLDLTQAKPESRSGQGFDPNRGLVPLGKLAPEHRPDDSPFTSGVKELAGEGLRILEGMTSPTNIGIMAVTGGVGGVARAAGRPALLLAARTAERGLAAYFAGQAGREFLQRFPDAADAYQKKDYPRMAKALGGAIPDAVMAGLTTAAAVRPHGPTGLLVEKGTAKGAWPTVERTFLERFVGVTPEQKLRGIAEQTVRHRRGVLDRDMSQTVEAVRDEYIRLNAQPKEYNHAIMDAIENAEVIERGKRPKTTQPDPANQRISDLMLKALDTEWDRIIDLKIPGLDRHFYETYFPHIFKRPGEAEGWARSWYAKRPLSGPESFRKHRIHPTLADARAAGLKLVSDNPVELYLLKLHELKKFRMAQEVYRDLESRGQLKHVPLSVEVDREVQGVPQKMRVAPVRPKGWKTIDDKIFRVGPRGIGGDILAPEPVAKTINNYLSPSLTEWIGKNLRGSLAGVATGSVDLLRAYNNNSNMLNVSLSGFHAFLESGVSMINDIGLAFKYATPGKYGGASNPFKAVKTLAQALPLSLKWSPVRDFRTGQLFREEYLNPGSHPDLAPLVEAFVQGGGRLHSDPILRDQFAHRGRLLDRMFDKMESEARKVGVEAAPKMMRQMFGYIMQEMVPRMKAGAFMKMAEFELERLGPNATLDQRRAVFAKAVDAIDDRMGQLNYDNLFVPKIVKDLGFLSTHFLGWTVGTVRAGAGGALDILRIPAAIAIGETPQLTQRAAWIMAMPFGYGAMNAMYQYMMTGQRPTEMKDFIFPKNGRTRPDGQPERDAFPMTAYLRDYYGWVTRPKQTLEGKFSNAVTAAWDIWVRNQTPMGEEIASPEADYLVQKLQQLRYILGRAEPISVQTLEQARESGEGLSQRAVSRAAAGIRPAAAYAMRSSAQNMMLDYNRRTTAIPAEQFERRLEATRLAEGLFAKTYKIDDVLKARQAGKITTTDASRIIREFQIDPWSPVGMWGRLFEHLQPRQALRVFRSATQEEKQKLLPLLSRQIANTYKEPNAQRAIDLRQQLQDEIRNTVESAQRTTTAPPAAGAWQIDLTQAGR